MPPQASPSSSSIVRKNMAPPSTLAMSAMTPNPASIAAVSSSYQNNATLVVPGIMMGTSNPSGSTQTKKLPTGENTGRWTKDEHGKFLEGLRIYGKEWKKISNMIESRTVVQIRTHAQKYFQKLAKSAEQQGKEVPGDLMSTARYMKPSSSADAARKRSGSGASSRRGGKRGSGGIGSVAAGTPMPAGIHLVAPMSTTDGPAVISKPATAAPVNNNNGVSTSTPAVHAQAVKTASSMSTSTTTTSSGSGALQKRVNKGIVRRIRKIASSQDQQQQSVIIALGHEEEQPTDSLHQHQSNRLTISPDLAQISADLSEFDELKLFARDDFNSRLPEASPTGVDDLYFVDGFMFPNSPSVGSTCSSFDEDLYANESSSSSASQASDFDLSVADEDELSHFSSEEALEFLKATADPQGRVDCDVLSLDSSNERDHELEPQPDLSSSGPLTDFVFEDDTDLLGPLMSSISVPSSPRDAKRTEMESCVPSDPAKRRRVNDP